MLTKTQIIGGSIGIIMLVFQVVATRQAFENFLKLLKHRHFKSDKQKKYGQQDQPRGGSKSRNRNKKL